jgi:hypothetical protein
VGLEQAARHLADVDARIDATGARHSLDPGRTQARSYAQVVNDHADGGPPLQAALARGLAALGEAILEHFPGNLFWDVDRLAQAAVDASDSPGSISEVFSTVVEVHARYGVHTPIRFRYVHDFSYGYDWAKWIKRGAAGDGDNPRVDARPFGTRFLAHMLARADELLALIAADDAKYPTLHDEAPRNPFPFSREPEAELALHRALAEHDEIPVRMWDRSAPPADRWDRPWADLRVARARAMGLAVR